MREEIIHFAPEFWGDNPFWIQIMGISYCDGTYKIERKNSSVYTLEYIIKGCGKVIVDHVEYSPCEGDIYMLPRGIDQYYYSDDQNPWTKIWINVGGELVDHLMKVYGLTNVYHIKNLNLLNLFKQMLENYHELLYNPNELILRNTLLFHEILVRIHGKLYNSQRIYSENALKIRNYIDANVENDICMKDIQKNVALSASQVIRIFKNEFGITPNQYLLQSRLQISKLLLNSTNLSIKEIAYKLQFSDEHYFSNFFKRRTGKSPRAFKNS